MEVRHVDSFNVMINEVYKVKREEYRKYSDWDQLEMIEKFSEMKKLFVEKVGMVNKSQITVLSELLPFEVAAKKDLLEFTYDEIVEIIKQLAERGIFTSKSLYNAYLNVIATYTNWAYHSEYRPDFISIQDMSKKIEIEDAMNLKLTEQKTLTRNEMDIMANQLNHLVVEVYIKSLMEGVEQTDLLNLKLDQFNDKLNHELVSGDNFVNVSDALYAKMYELAKADRITRHGIKGTDKDSILSNTVYLMRPVETVNTKNKQMNNQAIAALSRRSLKDLDYMGDARDFRTSAILNDVLDGMDVEHINKKYNLKYKFIEMMGNKHRLDVLREKRRNEVGI